MVSLLTAAGPGFNGQRFILDDPYAGEPILRGALYFDPASVFGGATVEVQGSIDGTAWHLVPGASYAALPASPPRIEIEAQYVRARTVGGAGTNVGLQFASTGPAPTPA